MKKTVKTIAVFASALCLLASRPMAARADMPYETYNFNFWGEEVLQPHSYLYSGSISTAQIGSALRYPQDMCIFEDHIYVADTGNSRILILNLDGSTAREVTAADGAEDLLNQPQGVFVTDAGHLYVADSGNSRIVEYDEDLNFIREIGRPETNLISASQAYTPVRLVVDHSDRIYVIAYGINMGLVEFDKDGVFQGFMGATEVSVSTFEYIWKNYFSTEAQQARMETIIPTEYSDIFVDDENFIYATISNLSEEDHMQGADMVRRLNPTGTDVLRRLGNNDITGDLNGRSFSTFVDVAATDYGCYFILDSVGGKIFAYDYDGNSLFAFGKKGIKEGNVQQPVALALGDGQDKIYVLDNTLGSILTFEITDYGRHLLDALRLNDIGDAEGSNREWQAVIQSNSNNEMAYIGLGKTYLAEGNYKQAMEYFRLGNSRKYYTKAFFYYRKELMEANFGKAMLVLGLGIVIGLAVYYVFRFRRWVGEVKCFMSKR